MIVFWGVILLALANASAFARSSPPIADFTFSPIQPKVGEEVLFDSFGSYDRDGFIQFFGWDFENDGEIDSIGARTRHVFRASGQFAVRLIVIDNEGLSSSIVKIVNVSEADKDALGYFILEGLIGTGGAFVGGFGGIIVGFTICGVVGEATCVLALTGCALIGSIIGSVTAVDIAAGFWGKKGNIPAAYLGATAGLLVGALIPDTGGLTGAIRMGLIGFGAAFGYNLRIEYER
ncbi:MAG: PKD domain-containing protein [Candidatus Bipolaricaulaceae bacterium]